MLDISVLMILVACLQDRDGYLISTANRRPPEGYFVT